ncbi:hypothetical protein A3B51_01190 [Candidatus Curtissbacteria bacterium RIFCSPLOWO2_01_FULL_41_18]|uniref:Steroid 5-alpha reductase C-terminal domain-containing protein n=2 Tax=Candidatus Curtissiibacteriota TaxID=1752717 RepID=A0A1F5FZ85_9BACT|nr:MAG: hypothetical protein A2696_00475 [Candidatus Curtissbacteria bacterium RIFCSPHIGHO2_01_FULL_41_13]OGE03607.1 MAG: hypothetical protein A3B51_01190 [Candidatus Curtissbacteria bacterium RIFCSPLOWO2_01_FULL_41_18]
MKDKTLLYLELTLIILLFYFGKFTAIFQNIIPSLVFILGTILAIWSLLTMQVRYFSPFPEPPKKHKLAQRGLYKYMLHPMYTGIMLIGLALLLSRPSFQIFLIYAVLMYVLDQKASLEEELLSKIYPQYKPYKQKTKKFIPKIY